jgi:ABC-type glycerol-3-phosphate transport system permease component
MTSTLASAPFIFFVSPKRWSKTLTPYCRLSKSISFQRDFVRLPRICKTPTDLANDMPGVVPDYPLIMAGALVVSAIPLAMVALLQRFIVRGSALSEK